MSKGILFDITSSVVLSEEEVFPDGVPDNYDAQHIVELLKESGSIHSAIRDWGLDQDLKIEVQVDHTFSEWIPW